MGQRQAEHQRGALGVFHDTVVADARGVPGVDGFKMYTGLDEMVHWLAFLSTIEFKDFCTDWSHAVDEGAVVVQQVSYVPIRDGNTGPKMRDLQRWTVEDGKVKAVDFMWQLPVELAAVFAPSESLI